MVWKIRKGFEVRNRFLGPNQPARSIFLFFLNFSFPRVTRWPLFLAGSANVSVAKAVPSLSLFPGQFRRPDTSALQPVRCLAQLPLPTHGRTVVRHCLNPSTATAPQPRRCHESSAPMSVLASAPCHIAPFSLINSPPPAPLRLAHWSLLPPRARSEPQPSSSSCHIKVIDRSPSPAARCRRWSLKWVSHAPCFVLPKSTLFPRPWSDRTS
jgi:hypothetical protein